jgi:hypothetical protein
MNEKQLERKCCREAERRGWLAWKMVSPNRIGVPDRIFIGPDGEGIFVEFKQPGGKVRPSQERTLIALTNMNHRVKAIDSFDIFMSYMGFDNADF